LWVLLVIVVWRGDIEAGQTTEKKREEVDGESGNKSKLQICLPDSGAFVSSFHLLKWKRATKEEMESKGRLMKAAHFWTLTTPLSPLTIGSGINYSSLAAKRNALGHSLSAITGGNTRALTRINKQRRRQMLKIPNSGVKNCLVVRIYISVFL
jgi:hypothetical protein